jgi:hypothetical protein
LPPNADERRPGGRRLGHADRRAVLRCVGVLLLMPTIGLTACGTSSAVHKDGFGLPVNRPLTRAQLLSHPEAQLHYPGSHVVQAVGSDEVAVPHENEPDPAYAGAILTAAATPARLYAWYSAQLTAAGYREITFYRNPDQVSGKAWRAPNGREQIQVAVFDPAQLAAQQKVTATAPAGGVVYQQVLVGYRVETK